MLDVQAWQTAIFDEYSDIGEKVRAAVRDINELYIDELDERRSDDYEEPVLPDEADPQLSAVVLEGGDWNGEESGVCLAVRATTYALGVSGEIVASYCHIPVAEMPRPGVLVPVEEYDFVYPEAVTQYMITTLLMNRPATYLSHLSRDLGSIAADEASGLWLPPGLGGI